VALSWPDFVDLKNRTTTLDVTAFGIAPGATFINGEVQGSGLAEIVPIDYFRVLGVHTAVGRLLQPSDEAATSPVAVLSYRTWQNVFGGSSGVVGGRLTVNGLPCVVVGVADREFAGAFNSGVTPTALWLALSPAVLDARASWPSIGAVDYRSRDARWLMTWGRIRPGRTFAEAQSEIVAIARGLDVTAPIGASVRAVRRGAYETSRPWVVTPVGGVLDESMRAARTTSIVLTSLVWLVLAVAFTNVANLMWQRNADRRTELGIRYALGASRASVVRECVMDVVVLAAAGGALSAVVERLILFACSTEVRYGALSLRLVPHMDVATVLTALGAMFLAVVVAGVWPAALATRRSLRTTIGESSLGLSAQWQGRRALIVAQVFVSTVLLVLAASAVFEIWRDQEHDPGFDVDQIAVLTVEFDGRHEDLERAHRIATATLQRIAANPAVESVALSSGLPIAVEAPHATFQELGGLGHSYSEVLASTPSIFQTLGIRIVRGRPFDDRDLAGRPGVVVLNEKAARDTFGSIDAAVGRDVRFDSIAQAGRTRATTLTVIGVASETDSSDWGRRFDGIAFLPLAQHYEPQLAVAIRARGDPARVISAARAALTAVDPELVPRDATTLAEIVSRQWLFTRVWGHVAAALAILALTLALTGLFGALSHVVTLRTHEIGIRMALGATRSGIGAMVLREGMGPVFVGLALGLFASVAGPLVMSAAFRSALHVNDVVLLGSVAGLFLIVGALACYVPASRAASVDPNVCLRQL
jgi:predicted permease